MQTFTTIIAALIAGTALAAPTPYQPSYSVDHLVKFDNIPAGVIDGVPLRSLNQLGSHEGLFYAGMGVISRTPLLAGLNAQSLPNVLAYDIVDSLRSPHELRTDYDDSTTTSFNFKSFYFGCVVTNVETLTSLPLSCSVRLTGYRNGKEVGSQQVDFHTPLLQLTADMDKVELNDGFCDVDRVTIETAGGVVESVLSAVLMDNFEYTTISGKKY